MQIYRNRTFNTINKWWLGSLHRLTLKITAWERRVQAFGKVTSPAPDKLAEQALCRLVEQNQDQHSVQKIFIGDGMDRAMWLLEGWQLDEIPQELQCYEYLLYLIKLRDYLVELKRAGELVTK